MGESKETVGVLLAGGTGSRLRPMTLAVNKHLLPVYDKPQIYYSLSTLILAGVRHISIICNPGEVKSYKNLLGDGVRYGVTLDFLEQPEANGIVGGLKCFGGRYGDVNLAVVLGDNLFHGPSLGARLSDLVSEVGCSITAYRVPDPHHFGVIEFDTEGNVLSIEEKPLHPRSSWVIPGLYFFDSSWKSRLLGVESSSRGELEIVDLLLSYQEEGLLTAKKLPRGTAWFDLGKADALLEAALYIRTVQNRQGLLIGSPEEAAVNSGLLTKETVIREIESETSEYYATLRTVLRSISDSEG